MRKWLINLVLMLSLACGSIPLSQQAGMMLTSMQISGAMTPTYEVPGDSHKGILLPLTKWVEKQGFVVVVSADPPSHCDCMGYTNWREKVLWVDSDQTANSQVSTMLHEGAHVISGQRFNSMTNEIIAETASYIAAGKLGLNTQRESFNYLSRAPMAYRDAVYVKYGLEIDQIAEKLVNGARRGE